jgi:hypothetical protein
MPIASERCGFASLDQLSAWFTDAELCRLAEFGFGVWEFVTGLVRRGDHQVLFVPVDEGRRVI